MAHVTVLTPNPAIDITYGVAENLVGETNRVSNLEKRPGGKGLNVARILHQLGTPSISVFPAGGESGLWLRRAVEQLHCTSKFVVIDNETRSTVTVTSRNAHPTVYAEPGPVLQRQEWFGLGRLLVEQLKDSSMLVIAGSLPPRANVNLIGGWIASARAAGVSVLVDTSGAGTIIAARAGVTVLKLNVQELLEATGLGNAAAAIRSLHRLGAQVVVVSVGENGILASDGHAIVTVPAVAGVSGNPTGAGDAATAGLVTALLGGHSLEIALEWASACGAAAVLEPVAGEISVAKFHEFLSQYERERRAR